MALTKRDNLLRVLRAQDPAWVPFAPNFAQWFKHHWIFDTLPPELRGCSDYVDAMKVLGCDIFSRNVDSGFRQRDTKLKPRMTIQQGSTGPRTTTVYETPHGPLGSVSQEISAISSSHQESNLVKDWQRDGDAFRSLLEQRECSWDEGVFVELDRRVGDDGIINVACGTSPLKMLHVHCGLEYACLFMMDHPGPAREVCDLYWASLRPVLESLAAHPRVHSVILMDNVDTPFYPPGLLEDFWVPYVKEAADLMRRRDTCLFVHACGKLSALGPSFARCGVTGLEGVSHAPLGDWTAARAQACHDQFVFVGGFSAREQEHLSDAQVRDFYQQYLGEARKQRFIFSSSCQTAVRTTWDRIKLVRDICRQWGGRPGVSTATAAAETPT